jgi:hypothetical protein
VGADGGGGVVVESVVLEGVLDGVLGAVVVDVLGGVLGAVVVVDALGGVVVVNETESASTRPAIYWLCVKARVLLPVLHAETGTDTRIVPLALLGPGPGQMAIPAPPLIDKVPQSVWSQSKQFTLRVEAVAPAGTVT